ncbi:hypothetical protein ACFWBB_06965 [Streptomyces sp. NPDC060000]|uniref:hypothetical protein n=1 Tax=Streptomyces sp. NPDC060000 TaxID=3347031 RepID=UPI00367DE48C
MRASPSWPAATAGGGRRSDGSEDDQGQRDEGGAEGLLRSRDTAAQTFLVR